MAAVYPTAVKTFVSRKNFTNIVDAGDVNQAYDEITSLQTVLGPMPHQDTLDGSTKTWKDVKTSIASARRGLTDPIVKLSANNIRVPFADDYFPVFNNKQVDTHGAWNGGSLVRSPRTGWYQMGAYIRWHKDGIVDGNNIPPFDHSGKLQVGISPSTDTTFVTGETHYFPNGWQDFTRSSCSTLWYWPKGSAVRVNLWQRVQAQGTMWATVFFTAAYLRDPASANNM